MSAFLSFLSLIVVLFSGGPSIPYDEIEKAFNSQNEMVIMGHAKEKVLLSINGSEKICSKSQSEQILKKFFSDYPNGKFKFEFKGEKDNNGAVSIGKYSSSDSSFTVTIEFKKIGNSFLIARLSIE